jgi:hypothetical protein
MFSIDFKPNPAIKDFQLLKEREIPFATSKGLNGIAFNTNRHVKAVLPTYIDRPTKWTINALYVTKSTKKHLQASLEYRNWATKGTPTVKIIHHLVYGGERRPKRSETLLRQHGVIRQGQWLVPAPGAKLDAYGNVLKSDMSRMLSALQATLDVNQRSKGEKRKVFFLSKSGKAIYKRQDRYGRGRVALPFMWVVDKLNYKKTYPFELIVKDHILRVYEKEMTNAINFTIQTRK